MNVNARSAGDSLSDRDAAEAGRKYEQKRVDSKKRSGQKLTDKEIANNRMGPGPAGNRYFDMYGIQKGERNKKVNAAVKKRIAAKNRLKSKRSTDMGSGLAKELI